MNIQDHIREHWDELPKSTFNDEEIVVFKEIRNADHGWGHHVYEGYGLDRDGNLIWAYSSGCSCNGSCETRHEKDAKTFHIEWPEEFSEINPEGVNFSSLQVEFSDY